MTLEGTRAAGTDLHSKTANILGISRNHAKVFNYGRIYGAGLKFATTLLKQFNPDLTDDAAAETAGKLYDSTKGKKMKARKGMPVEKGFWYGGTESYVFNRLEEFAEQDNPRTPVLGAGLTEALHRINLSPGGFLTSRINWAIQSSGVDYLHLLIVGMDYLIRKYGLNARLAITVHDEIRYLVKSEHKYKVAMALQVANIWTRAMFSEQMGIHDLPQSCAYFSAVDIDTVLRKEVDLNCVTPSHPDPIPPGECLGMEELIERGEEARLELVQESNLQEIEYEPRKPVMQLQAVDRSEQDRISFIEAQMAKDVYAVNKILRNWGYKKNVQNATKPTVTRKMSAAPRFSVPRKPSTRVAKIPVDPTKPTLGSPSTVYVIDDHYKGIWNKPVEANKVKALDAKKATLDTRRAFVVKNNLAVDINEAFLGKAKVKE